jgi:hypothetical protein
MICPQILTTGGLADTSVKHISWFTDTRSTQYGWGGGRSVGAEGCSLIKLNNLTRSLGYLIRSRRAIEILVASLSWPSRFIVRSLALTLLSNAIELLHPLRHTSPAYALNPLVLCFRPFPYHFVVRKPPTACACDITALLSALWKVCACYRPTTQTR